MKKRTVIPSKKFLKNSFVKKALYKGSKKKKRVKTFSELQEKHGHVFDRQMLQGSSGMVLANLAVPKKKRGKIMRATQELYNQETLSLMIDMSVHGELDEIRNYKDAEMRNAAFLIKKIETNLGSLELTEHYLSLLNKSLLANYDRIEKH